MLSHNGAYAMVIDEQSITSYLSDINSPTASDLIGWCDGQHYYRLERIIIIIGRTLLSPAALLHL